MRCGKVLFVILSLRSDLEEGIFFGLSDTTILGWDWLVECLGQRLCRVIGGLGFHGIQSLR